MGYLNEPIRAIIFDFDGTLVDSMRIKLDAFVSLFEVHGREVTKKVEQYQIANGGLSRYEKIRHLHKTLLNQDLSDEEVEALASEFSLKVEKMVALTPFVPGAFEFLEQHHRDLHFFVASAAPTDELNRIMKDRKMSPYFRGIYGSPTSKVEAIKTILNQNKWRPEEALFVGDSHHDYDAAQRMHCPFVGVARHGQFFPNAIAHVDNLLDLKEIIEF